MTYSSEHRQRIAQAGKSGGARRNFIQRLREDRAEYKAGWIDSKTLALELDAAFDDLDRRKPASQGRGR